MSDMDEINKSLERINAQYGEALKRLSEDEKEERQKKLSDALDELGKIMREDRDEYDKEAESWWINLPYEDRLKAFYSVCKRIHKGDIKDKGSYRYVLYEVFDFGFEAYTLGMNCGYMDIHNSIVTDEEKETKDTQ